MKKQAFNPYLPSWEYVPDGEPYVFGNRVYVYGSHDKFNGKGFCLGDYVCWSAPTDDLGNWKYEGVIYRRNQDPKNKNGSSVLNAPDVQKGPDGRYYLYYVASFLTVISVAVSDKPEGPYEFYGYVKYNDGKLYGKRRKDAYNFDPSVFMDEDGRIYLYTGFSPDKGLLHSVMGMRGNLDGAYGIELEPDMLTMKGKPVMVAPGPLFASGTGFDNHAFYEASSMRKINGTYYFVYSSVLSHELCYATGKHPLGPFTYGGTLVSIGDIGIDGNQKALNYLGNTHGGMAEINGQWYIFYHRQTNKQKCARQGCAEKITILPDGSVPQAELTSCGLNSGALSGKGIYEARIACHLMSRKGTFIYDKSYVNDEEEIHPYFTQSGEDRDENPDQYIANMTDGSTAGFKYFQFDGPTKIQIMTRGTGTGKMEIKTSLDATAVGHIQINPSKDWQTSSVEKIDVPKGSSALYFVYIGDGYIDFDQFELL